LRQQELIIRRAYSAFTALGVREFGIDCLAPLQRSAVNTSMQATVAAKAPGNQCLLPG